MVGSGNWQKSEMGTSENWGDASYRNRYVNFYPLNYWTEILDGANWLSSSYMIALSLLIKD